MMSIVKVISKLENYLIEKAKKDVFVYTGRKEMGSLLIKNKENNKKIIVKPSESTIPIGGKRLQDFIIKTSTFKGQSIDHYIYLSKDFKDIAKRYTKRYKSLTLISFNSKKRKIVVYGSMNVDLAILNHIIEFADHSDYSISYDFEGVLNHQGFDKKKEKVIAKVEKAPYNPRVFFSYSWDSQEHRFWVLKLASDLIKDGISVLIDEWDLNNYNSDLHQFMETGIREADKVILICTPNYAKKANNRLGGVGVENTIITGEFYDKKKSNKFIAIIRESEGNLTDALPTYLKTKFAIDFTNNDQYNSQKEDLMRKILNVPKFKKPKLGRLPILKSSEL